MRDLGTDRRKNGFEPTRNSSCAACSRIDQAVVVCMCKGSKSHGIIVWIRLLEENEENRGDEDRKGVARPSAYCATFLKSK